MLQAEVDWKNRFKQLELDKTGAVWAANLATAIDELTTDLLEIANIITKPAKFTFNKATFQSGIASISTEQSAAANAAQFANAWAAAINASQMVVEIGASIAVVTPLTTFGPIDASGNSYSIVTAVDAPSVAAAKTDLEDGLLEIEPVKNADDSTFAKLFRDAFLALTYTTTGFDSTPLIPSTSTPLALVNPAAPTK